MYKYRIVDSSVEKSSANEGKASLEKLKDILPTVRISVGYLKHLGFEDISTIGNLGDKTQENLHQNFTILWRSQ